MALQCRQWIPLSLYFVFQCLTLVASYDWRAAILNSHIPGESSNETTKYCVHYSYNISYAAKEEADVRYYQIYDAMDWDICSNSSNINTKLLENKLLLIPGQANCSIYDRTMAVQAHKGAGILFVLPSPVLNETEELNATIVIIHNATRMHLLERENVEVGLYAPEEFDQIAYYYSLIVIWLLAMFCVTSGSFWSGRVRNKLYSYERDGPVSEGNQVVSGGPGGAVMPHEETSLPLSPKLILGFVIMMCTMLLCLYFLYDYLVYVILAMFVIASSGAVYGCLEGLIMQLPCGTCRTPYFNLYIIHGTLELRQMLLVIFSLSMAITWVVLRKEPWAWILQDTLGVFFCINMLKVIRLPNLMIITVLLCLLFVYDIFFVFITPFITADGKSIMVEVAKGGSSGEQLPMVFMVPHFVLSQLAMVCQPKGNYNLLGFGDVLVPGLLVSFAYSFDLQMGTPGRCLYFVVNVLMYGCGLLVTFLGLYLMGGAQPALLYLVPFTLIPTISIAAIRGELNTMWSGVQEKLSDGVCEGDVTCDEDDDEEEDMSDESPDKAQEATT